MSFLAAGNPFMTAYFQADWFGKFIFLALLVLSGVSWTVLLHKWWVLSQVKRLSKEFAAEFDANNPLGLKSKRPIQGRLLEVPHPCFAIYKALKHHALALMSREKGFIAHREARFSKVDLEFIDLQVQSEVISQGKKLEKNLFILSMTVTLAPFLGLLGTVWGILTAFSAIQIKGGPAMMNNAVMLSGLALALTTTVLGLVVAIPALIGYSYLKNSVRESRRDMDDFARSLSSALELCCRRPDHASQTLSS